MKIWGTAERPIGHDFFKEDLENLDYREIQPESVKNYGI